MAVAVDQRQEDFLLHVQPQASVLPEGWVDAASSRKVVGGETVD
jgi:hypothetical protein